MGDWVEKIREPLDLKRATSLKVQVNAYQCHLCQHFIKTYCNLSCTLQISYHKLTVFIVPCFQKSVRRPSTPDSSQPPCTSPTQPALLFPGGSQTLPHSSSGGVRTCLF